jgi:DNA-binding MarR family transcriptional regulator
MKIRRFLEQSPLFAIYSLHDTVVGQFQDRLKEEGIHFLQALIITGIFFEERAARPSAMAEILGCSRSNMSHALRDLERKALVERALVAGDARAYQFSLSREGKKLAQRLIRHFDLFEESLENHFREQGLIGVTPSLQKALVASRDHQFDVGKEARPRTDAQT